VAATEATAACNPLIACQPPTQRMNLLAAHRFSGTRPVAGFGFGAPAASSAAGPAAANAAAVAGGAAAAGTDPLELSAQLDGELAQCLRHLSKRDTTTKLKALQVCGVAVSCNGIYLDRL
jgi:hypothetical protein